MNDKRLAANRKNARKSTGPKTSAGKAASSRNAVTHGVLAAAPVLPGLESLEDWEGHRAGVVESLAPVGYIENLLAERIALLSWRLRRVVRYEVEVATASAATAEMDMEDQAKFGSGKPEDPAESRGKSEAAGYIVAMLEDLPEMPAHEKLYPWAAQSVLCPISAKLPDEAKGRPIAVPGVPDDREEFDKFNLWTADLLRKCIEVYAAARKMTADGLRNKTILAFTEESKKKEEQAQLLAEQGRKWKLLLNRIIRTRMLLAPDILDKVTRYENSLERSLFRNLHELQKLQAARSGVAVTPPAVVDVDVNVHPEGKS
jgi:hypothetical protein